MTTTMTIAQYKSAIRSEFATDQEFNQFMSDMGDKRRKDTWEVAYDRVRELAVAELDDDYVVTTPAVACQSELDTPTTISVPFDITLQELAEFDAKYGVHPELEAARQEQRDLDCLDGLSNLYDAPEMPFLYTVFALYTILSSTAIVIQSAVRTTYYAGKRTRQLQAELQASALAAKLFG